MKKGLLLAVLSGLFLVLCGFNLENAIVPRDEIVSGGPPKDGIPAIMDPTFVSAESIEYLEPDEQVISLEIDGEIKAYPINILTWHEIVNDEVGGTPVAVTF